MGEVSYLKNYSDAMNKLNGFIYRNEDDKEIYLLGRKSYINYFVKNYPKQLFKIFYCSNVDGEEFFEFQQEMAVIKSQETIKIVCFFDDYIAVLEKLIQQGLSPINNVFDGMVLLEIRREPQRGSASTFVISDHTKPTGGRVNGGIYEVEVHDSGAETTKKVTGSFGMIRKVPMGYLAVEDKEGLVLYDKDFCELQKIAVDNNDMHGFDFHPEDKDIVFVVESMHNAIGIYNLVTGKKEDEIRLSHFQQDRNHINDIAFQDRKLYLSIFSISGCFNKYNERTTGMDAAIIYSDINDLTGFDIYKENLVAPHTLYPYNKDLLYCDSVRGDVYCNKQKLCQVNAFTRGLYYDGYCLYIGQSNNRKLYDYNQYLCTDLASGMHIYVPATRTIRFVPMPEIQNPYGILVI